MLRAFFESGPVLGFSLQAACVYMECLRNATVASETSNTLKGHTKAFAALAKELEADGKARDMSTVRACLLSWNGRADSGGILAE
eukprot:3337464-Amphidinium_carterae.1